MPLNDDAAQESMRAAVLNEYIGAAGLVVQDVPRPVPGAGEVLIEVAATPINPSDLAFLEGNYSPRPSLPTRAGLEGSGTVVAAGPGAMGRYLSGKRVAFVAGGRGGGAWAEYVVVPNRLALPLGDEVSFEAGAMSVVNPLTALAFLEIAKSGDHKGVINTAAAGALGRMVDRVLRGDGIKVINVVRRSDQARSLTDSGAEIALDSSSCDFDSELRQACASLDARLAFDAVGGVLTRRLLSAMPPGSTVMVYGGLAEQPSQADIGDLVFEGKTVAGFWLTRWLPQKNPLQSLRLWRKVQRLIGGELSSEIRDTYPLESIGDAVSSYETAMSSGKVLIIPSGGSG
jgi:NADPH:quinone reductase-like Zn-dependent oxidoreductase